MASRDSLATRELLRVGTINHIKDDLAVALRLRYIGTGTVTSVIVTAATDITMITSDGGTDAYLFATYTTLGALVDAINGDGIFEAKILDGLRADSTGSSTLKSATISPATIDGITTWSVVTDTSVLKKISAGAVVDRGFSMGKALADKKFLRLKKLSYNVNVSAAEASAVKVTKRKGSTETTVASWTSVDATVTTPFDWTASEFSLVGKPGEEFVVSVQDATSVTDDAANFVEVAYEVV